MEDRELRLVSGWAALVGVLLGLGVLIALIAAAIMSQSPALLWLIIPGSLAWVISLLGFIVNGPNMARVVLLFGAYVGTLKDVGFFYGNPFYLRSKVSLRIRSLETGVTSTEERKDATGRVVQEAKQQRQPLKVNDKDGTPIEIAAVVVWKVANAAQAMFQVDNYVDFVKMQADAALRNLASRYSYDAPEGDEHSLRGHIEAVAVQLKSELHERIHQAGVEILDARISYLAYATEIAAAMLQRQQAGAIIAARSRIVEGAVGMVEHALQMLSEKHVVDLDPERRAAMVSNLLVVLCGHAVPQPVLNTGTLHN
ncbi:MAG TPA: SPFH domain-containing protein [Gemmataceae bacterium]|nr:SPFH domain-containing protein [Gemmataceae bacterium]